MLQRVSRCWFSCVKSVSILDAVGETELECTLSVLVMAVDRTHLHTFLRHFVGLDCSVGRIRASHFDPFFLFEILENSSEPDLTGCRLTAVVGGKSYV